MEMTIDELIMFCEEKEYNHRVSCKRYDDASGYTRSKDKSIRTASAEIEETNADYYREIADIMRKYQKIEQIIDNWTKSEEIEWQIRKVLDGGNDAMGKGI